MHKVSEIDRAANSPVASATRNFTYDTNGYLATATDWNGNSTHWTNNSHGQPTSITEAYGAGVARTTTITYDSTWVHKPYTITKTNVTIDDRYNGTTGTLTSHTLTDTTGGSTNGHTQVWAYTYNGTGEMLTETFPRTGTTVKNTYTYTAARWPASPTSSRTPPPSTPPTAPASRRRSPTPTASSPTSSTTTATA